MVASIPTRQPILESITPILDPQDAYRFTVPAVGRAVPVRATIVGSNADFAMYMLDGNQNIFANDTTFGARTKSITRTLAAGTYYVFVITQGARGTPPVNYQLTLEANLPVTPPPPPPPAQTQISYGGFLYSNHTGTTTMTPSMVPTGGFFTITSTTMPFSGAGKQRVVLLERTVPGSGGQTRFALTNVTQVGNTLTVQAPAQAIFGGGQVYNVVVVTWTNGLPDDYANPGMPTIF